MRNEKPNGYRPINLLPALGKMYERIINFELLKIFSKFNTFDENQFGHLKGKSTEMAILKVLELIELYKRVATHIPYHSMLKMPFLSLRNILPDWLEITLRSYFNNRKVIVECSDHQCLSFDMEKGLKAMPMT